MSINFSKLYDTAMRMHAQIPYTLWNGNAFPPLRISFMVTYRCNLNCQMCFQRKYREQNPEKEELSFDAIKRIIDQAPHYTLFTWTGGEPFARKDMIDILQYASLRNPCNILTNATLLNEEKIKVIVDSKVKLLGISIDGIGKEHDIIRGIEGSFKKTLKAIQLLQRYKRKKQSRFPLLDIKTMVLAENIGQLQNIVDLAIRLKADYLTLSFPFGDAPFNPIGQQTLTEFTKYKEKEKVDIRPFLECINKLDTKSSKLQVRLYPDLELKHHKEFSFTDMSEYQPCKIPWSHLWIAPNGDVFPCLPYEIGNVSESDLKTLWNNQSFQNFRNRIKKKDVLPGCVGCCYLKQKEIPCNYEIDKLRR